jgi:nucleoside-diphosphate-sugar epimerase
MQIAILGASSHIAKDFILSCAISGENNLHLFARRPQAVKQWLGAVGLSNRYLVQEFTGFGDREYDAVINFIGAGNPEKIALMGTLIFDITMRYDEIVLNYLRSYPSCRYIFLSSGAAYGSGFDYPSQRNTVALVPVNSPSQHDWYGIAKLCAECKHRAQPESAIFDLRVFNYFSRTQDLSARFLITDILRAIRDKTILKVSSGHVIRDYIHPSDFFNLVSTLLLAPAENTSVDCYSLAPIEKFSLLTEMKERFGLRFEVTDDNDAVNATGYKPNYYSMNTRAADLGYQPRLTSLDGILFESEAILSSSIRT